MNKSELHARMDARIEEGEREARAWLREKWWAVTLACVGMVAGPAALWLYSMQSGQPFDLLWFGFSAFPGVIAGIVCVDKANQKRMEARRDAALMEMEHANIRMGARADVEVGWADRFRYAPRMFWVTVALLLGLITMKASAIFKPDSTWLEVSLDVALWSWVWGLSLWRMLKQEKQEQLTRARVMYREAAEAGADLRGAFSLAVGAGAGELEMRAERSEHSGVEGVTLDLDASEVEAEVREEVAARR